MNIISRIKSWFEPKIEEPAKKATMKFKNGILLTYCAPNNPTNKMQMAIDGFVLANRDFEREKLMRERLMNAHPLTQIRMHNNQCGSFSQITMNDIMGRW